MRRPEKVSRPFSSCLLLDSLFSAARTDERSHSIGVVTVNLYRQEAASARQPGAGCSFGDRVLLADLRTKS